MSGFVFGGKFRAKGGREEELLSCLLRAAEAMRDVESCLCYLVCRAPKDPTTVRVFEVWESKEAHDDSLSLPAVRALVSEALPLLEERPSGESWDFVGGKGLS